MFVSTAAASSSPEGGGTMVEEMAISSVPPQVPPVHVEDAVEAAAVMVAASSVLPMVAASFIPAVELAVTAAFQSPDSILENALPEILSKNQVHLTDPTAMDLPRIEDSIASLDCLIRAIQQHCDATRWASIDHASNAPGFETANHLGSWAHRGPVLTPYQTLESANSVGENNNAAPPVPMVSPKVALGYYIGIRAAWEERRRWAESVQTGRSQEQVCSCIGEWQHTVGGNTLNRIGNQVLEQAMIQEVNSLVSANLNGSSSSGQGMEWDLRYTEDLCPKPDAAAQLYVPSAMVRVLSGRDEYIATVATKSLTSAISVDIATCYVFYHDPAHRYILMDLLPYIARKGIQVRVLVDLMTVESALIKSVFSEKRTNKAKKTSSPTITRSGVDPLSFLNVLPEFAPPFCAKGAPSCPRLFLEQLLAVAAAIPNNKFQIRWWCARDSQTGYRIKNHAKCYSFDADSGDSSSYAIIGGSNVAPSIDSGDSDCDLLVNGCVAARVAGTFNYLWDQLITKTSGAYQSACSVPIAHPSIVTPSSSMSSDDSVSYLSDNSDDVDQEKWSDSSAAIAVIRSTPSSAGEDLILRHVIGAISAASRTVDICMGHSNKPLALAWALRNATERGVRVRLIVNSIYSCDLRVNQRDLFLSVRQLLQVAPKVEVWATALPSMRKRARSVFGQDVEAVEEGMDTPPPFVHAKYVVIDSKWVAVGSWNLWHRSAFHEIEHELLIQSESVAAILTEKFDKERRNFCVRIMSEDECTPGTGFCPLGCSLCKSFGPFYN